MFFFFATFIAEDAAVSEQQNTPLLAHTKEVSKKCGKCGPLEINWFKMNHFCAYCLFIYFFLLSFEYFYNELEFCGTTKGATLCKKAQSKLFEWFGGVRR